MKTSRRCGICGEKVEFETENTFLYLIADNILDLKTHFHYKKHNKKYLKTKGVFKRLGILFAIFLLILILLPIYLITLPFWWIHEKLFV